jgi:aminopeptidase-like protein
MEGVERLSVEAVGARGEAMHALAAELYPITRSITGDGVRRTLARIGQEIPLQVHEVPSGTPALDWTVPDEWNVTEAWVADEMGRRVIDFAEHNLHLVSYSIPVRDRLPLAELRKHLFSLPDHPDWIPYRTSYYDPAWGFCLSQRQLDALEDGTYEVLVDSTLAPGHLTYGECVLPGSSDEEVLISCHVCHPSLANDNLSGITVAAELARALGQSERRYTYRFVFAPGTIGALTWLSRNEEAIARVSHGLVLTCVGDPGDSTYKRSRRGSAAIDRAVEHILVHSGGGYTIEEFSPYGYDERQYCSPGFDLPIGCLMRSKHGTFPEYHTSADDMELVRPEFLVDTLQKCLAVFEVLERDATYVNQSPYGEPQLGRRGLYKAIGGEADQKASQMAILWVLNLSDGSNSLLDIAERSELAFDVVARAAAALLEHELLAPAD